MSNLFLAQVGKWMFLPTPSPLPGEKGNLCPIYPEYSWRGGPDGEIWGGGLYPYPAHPQESLFLTRTVFITIA